MSWISVSRGSQAKAPKASVFTKVCRLKSQGAVRVGEALDQTHYEVLNWFRTENQLHQANEKINSERNSKAIDVGYSAVSANGW